ncbi:DNA/RNA polymerases superfamily protein [Gossypium australe]|uniref:DNA/RNA polymerases superfamily protein n=1 Tax=Gossypium australe TaxID=47621 RepID=A0A5B6VN69_9ROSI|nr:DNA/RNA polymerases superfamily protein [Gossypium australe]
MKQNLVWDNLTAEYNYNDRICVPNNLNLNCDILSEAHSSTYSIHPGSTKVYCDLKQMYWWLGMKYEIYEFVAKCLICKQPVTRDFVSGLHVTPKKEDSIWVIVDRLTKLAKLYVSEIVRLHGVSTPKISDRDPRFTSRFWSKLREALGTKLNFSATFHPETNGQSKRVIQILEDMLQCYIFEFEGSWEKYLPLAEFTYNNSYQPSIKMALFKALYGRKCKTPLYWSKLSESKMVGIDLIQETEDNVRIIRDCLKVASVRQKLFVDLKRKDIEICCWGSNFFRSFTVEESARFGKKEKLSPRFIGLYEITKRIDYVAYILALPPELDKIHNVFCVSMLRRYRSDPSHVIPHSEIELQYLTYSEEQVKILAREVKELQNKSVPLVKVLWHRHSIVGN